MRASSPQKPSPEPPATTGAPMTKPALRRPFRRYVAMLLLAAVASLLPVAALNFVVDPLGQFGVVATPKLDGHRPSIGSRTYKAESVLRGEWDVVLLGDSVTEIGFNPQSAEWKGARVFNAALPGANMYELRHAVNAIAARGNTKRIYLVASMGQWNDIYTTRHDFDKSRFNPKLSLPDHWLEGLLGLRATEFSVETLLAARKNRPVLFTPLGLRTATGIGRDAVGYRRMFDDRAKPGLKAERGQRILAPSRLELFREVLDACRAHGIELTVIIPPTHATALEIFFLLDRFTAYEDLKRGIVRVMAEEAKANPGKSPFPLWDFSDYHELTMERIPAASETKVKMKWFWEQDHIKKELGDMVLRRVNGGTEPAGFGTQVTPENLEEHLAAIRLRHEEYKQQNPREIEHLEQLNGNAAGPNPKP